MGGNLPFLRAGLEVCKGDDGKPWVASNDAVKELAAFENQGVFDDPLPHNAVLLQTLLLVDFPYD
jgi:hypothetical protein